MRRGRSARAIERSVDKFYTTALLQEAGLPTPETVVCEETAQAMSATPAALQLRLLQTMVEVAAEKNSTLVLPFPVEMLRFFEAAASGRVTLPTTDAAEPERGREPVSEPLLRSNGHGA